MACRAVPSVIQAWAVKAGWGFFMRLQGSSLSAPSWKRYVLNRPRPMALMWTGLSTASRGPNSSCRADALALPFLVPRFIGRVQQAQASGACSR